jgi:hypothetical protein
MSYTELRFLPFILRLRDHFHQQSYSFGVTQNYPVAVRRFLRNLERRGRRVESISPAEVESYLDTLRIRRGRGAFPAHSRRMHRAAIHMLLRLVRSEWPPAPTPTDARELSEQHIVGAYDDWMKELRGLSMGTRCQPARNTDHRSASNFDQGRTVI